MMLPDTTPDPEKYGKARKQQQRKHLMILLGSLALMATLFLHSRHSEGSPVLKRRDAIKSALTATNEGVARQKPVDLSKLVEKVEDLDKVVRRIKESGVIMETDKESLTATSNLQEATRELLYARYGPDHPHLYRVEVTLQFQKGSPEFDEKGPDGSILLELAPSKLQPHSIFMFLEVARQFKGAAFHRIAGHVLQVMVKGGFPRLAFQEYSKEYPHEKGTVGYAGRPSGPAWYVSIQNNTRNHGPGSQQKKNPYEADSCFGKVIQGFDNEVQRIAKIPDKGFLSDRSKHVLITKMTILVHNGEEYVEWKDSQESP